MDKIPHAYSAPLFGAAYYPEDWDESEQERDIVRMREARMNAMRFAEFAWSKLEPEDGVFDFTWLHRVVDRLGAAGIGSILGTPTACPPRWLTKKYPDMFHKLFSGPAMQGARRDCCSNNRHYIEYSRRIVEKMAEEFGDDPNVIGWQIDNEIYSWEPCLCPDCVAALRARLKKKFGTIEALNAAWNLNLFSQHFDSFDDIEIPSHGWQNPHIKLEMKLEAQAADVRFVKMQADILHKHTSAPISTDVMPFAGIDDKALADSLDLLQFNHYNSPGDIQMAAFWYDYLRTLKQRPFWVTETATCWNGSTEIVQSIKPDGWCTMNSWLPLILGGEANMYWLWRTHWAGHELMHGAVLDASGRPMIAYDEVCALGRDFPKAAELLNSTRVGTEVGFHFSSLCWNMWETQGVVSGLKYPDRLYNTFYAPLLDEGVRPDVIDPSAELGKYKLIFTPMLMTLGDELTERIEQWVRDGGVWVAGPLTDIRNSDGARYRDRPTGILEKLSGAKWDFLAPDLEGRLKCEWSDGSAFDGGVYYDLYEDAEPDALARVKSGFAAANGKSIVVRKKVGKGEVILLGTFPSQSDMRKLIALACADAGVACGRVSGRVAVSDRVDEAGRIVCTMLAELGNAEAEYMSDAPTRDILTGESFAGNVPMKPYQVRVLVK